jgi:RHS repeat-associated protein
VQPHAPNHIGVRTYTYDLDGNQTGWTHDQNGTRRTIVWDDENRVQSIADNGQTKTYKYDDQGNRVIKRGPQGETVYVNQFFTQRPGANGTKHIYVGTTRIASKLLRQDAPNSNPNGNTPFEKDIFFYHPDHAGSTNYVTDLNGKLFEHIEYFPFGESWVEENTNQQRTPYLFSAKELDEETGLYYFGKRYYDPRTSVWQSADPVLPKYLPGTQSAAFEQVRAPSWQYVINLAGQGGVFNSLNLNFYSYVHNNPLAGIDPNGEEKFGIGIEVPDPNAFRNGVHRVDVDTGHTFSYVIDNSGKVTTSSFGPSQPIGPRNKNAFQSGQLPGTGTWPLSGNAVIYEWDISTEQYNRGVAAIQQSVSRPPNYSPTVQCTSEALEIARTVGVDVPSGVSTATFSQFGVELWRGNVANPYALGDALKKSGKQGTVINTSGWPQSRGGQTNPSGETHHEDGDRAAHERSKKEQKGGSE